MTDLNKIKEELERTLPVIISREKVEEYTGGVYCMTTMRNFDYNGNGPEEVIRISDRKIAYPKSSFIKWFMEKISEVNE